MSVCMERCSPSAIPKWWVFKEWRRTRYVEVHWGGLSPLDSLKSPCIWNLCFNWLNTLDRQYPYNIKLLQYLIGVRFFAFHYGVFTWLTPDIILSVHTCDRNCTLPDGWINAESIEFFRLGTPAELNVCTYSFFFRSSLVFCCCCCCRCLIVLINEKGEFAVRWWIAVELKSHPASSTCHPHQAAAMTDVISCCLPGRSK